MFVDEWNSTLRTQVRRELAEAEVQQLRASQRDIGLDEIADQYLVVVQQRLDAFARTRNYDGILSACTYASSAVPRFAAEGQYAVDARDATWAKCYDLLAQVQAGTLPQPTLPALLDMLPALEWPA